MERIVRRDIPHTYAISADELRANEIFALKRYNTEKDDFVLVRRSDECIVFNKDLENLQEVRELTDKIMQSKYIPEKLLDRFSEIAGEKAEHILLDYYSDWRKEQKKKELNQAALRALKNAKKCRISQTVKQNKTIIEELFNIGFGLYEERAVCNYQQGAENAFMYGYLLGATAQGKAVR